MGAIELDFLFTYFFLYDVFKVCPWLEGDVVMGNY